METISLMKTETARAVKKPHFIVQLLIFCLIFVIITAIMVAVAVIPTLVWLFGNEAFIEAAVAGDMETVFAITAEEPSWMMQVELGLTAVEIIVPVFYCLIIEKRNWRSLGLYKTGAVKPYLAGLFLGAVLISAVLGITCLLGGAQVRLVDAAEIPVGSILLFFVLYMIQGAAEEVLVRGYLMMSLTNGIKGKHKEVWAVVLSAAVFSALHLTNPGITALAAINLFLSGVMFGVLVLRTDNLFCACALHTAWNFFQGNIWGVLVSGIDMKASVFTTTPTGADWLSGGAFGLEGGVACLAVEAVAIVLMLVLLPKKKTMPEPIAAETAE